jgi:SAM-dependent methyltransferase
MADGAADVAALGAQVVAELRGASSTVDKLLLHEGPELLDLASTPAHVKQRILDDVERISRLLQLQRYWVRRIGTLISRAWRLRRGRPVRVLDVGAGSGGLLFQVDEWARRRRIAVELVGIDFLDSAVAAARRRAAEEGRRVELRVGDARRLDLQAGAVDVAVTTLMLHHLPPGDVAAVLAELDRVAAVSYFAFDLRRSLAALPALWALLRLGGFDAPSRHDALVSVRRAYSVPELEALLRVAGVQGFAVTAVPPAFVTVTRG